MGSSPGSLGFAGNLHRRIWDEEGNLFMGYGEIRDIDKSLSHCKNNVQSMEKVIS